MAGATTTADFSDLSRLIDELGGDFHAAHQQLPVIADALLSSIQDVFEAEGAVGRNPKWDKLKKSTLRGRRGSGFARILQDTGLLAASPQSNTGDTWVEAFTDVPYASFHRTGTKFMTARDFMAIDHDEFNLEASDVFLEVMTRGRR